MELLKLNLIWMYDEFSETKDEQLLEQNFIQMENDWRYIYNHEEQYKNKLFWPIYLISLIRQLEDSNNVKEYRSKTKKKLTADQDL